MALLNGFKETETEQQYRRGEIYYINAAAEQNQNRNDDQYGMTGDDGFMNIPDGEELPPFN